MNASQSFLQEVPPERNLQSGWGSLDFFGFWQSFMFCTSF